MVGCNVADILGLPPCPATSGYQCACVAPGGEAWVPLSEVRTRCAKLAKFIELEIDKEGMLICRVRAAVVGGSVVEGRKAGSGAKHYYGQAAGTSGDSFDNCYYSVPDGPDACGGDWSGAEFDLLCEQLV